MGPWKNFVSATATRLGSDKKTLQGNVHFVLPEQIGRVTVISGIEPSLIHEAIDRALVSRP